ncbi:MAG: rRNA maturation RNase YbeY [Candidatus Omnitrophica bacterium]|nr:rRNA maturation RNase YbeY [Candidatus Omnitrophota bacterium]
MEIIIANEQREARLNLKEVKATAKNIAGILKLPPESMLSITFVSKYKIRRLNKRYFDKSAFTDVIALGYRGRTFKGARDLYLGDIIIAPLVAKENARAYKNSFSSELNLCITHGILHLLGFSDKSSKEKEKMRKKEEQALKRL